MSEASERREQAYRKRVRAAGIGLRLARSAFRKRQSWLDRLLTRLLRRATTPRTANADFMRDELVDASIGFDPEELSRYQQGGAREPRS